jgi:hypothetical protein
MLFFYERFCIWNCITFLLIFLFDKDSLEAASSECSEWSLYGGLERQFDGVWRSEEQEGCTAIQYYYRFVL